jgi:chemotaxis protein CheD
MIGIAPHIEKIFLNPGELLLTKRPVAVTTVLGSCIAVTFVARGGELAAICHAVLPSGTESTPGKYIDHSLRGMIDFFRDNGIKRREITIKVFGGSDMFAAVNPAANIQTIGAQNIRKVFTCLKEAGLETAATDVGGTFGRKLI